MARVLEVFLDSPHPCAYLPNQTARLEHRVQLDVSAPELQSMLADGIRRFGPDYFRPRCTACHACTPTRVPVASFAPSKSQRRVLRQNAGIQLEFGAPSVDAGRLALYANWHGEREERRGWSRSELSADHYAMQFAFPHPAIRELTMRDGNGRLVGVSVVDETPAALSAVYFFSDARLARQSLGVFNVLMLLKLAAELGKAHVYLGFLVEQCASLAYKANYRPQEHLRADATGTRSWQAV
jgi:leucyl-tRNA---protein transferase